MGTTTNHEWKRHAEYLTSFRGLGIALGFVLAIVHKGRIPTTLRRQAGLLAVEEIVEIGSGVETGVGHHGGVLLGLGL